MHWVSLQVAAEDRINWLAFSVLKIIGLRRKRFIQTAAHNFESATAEESRIIRYRGAFAWTLPENPSATKPENETQDLYRGAADVPV
jgi:hypothetical protein